MYIIVHISIKYVICGLGCIHEKGDCGKMNYGIGSGSLPDSVQIRDKGRVSFHEIQLKQNPVEIFSAVCKNYEYAYLLESLEGPRKLARYSYVGFDPRLIVKIMDGTAEIHSKESSETSHERVEDPLLLLKRIIGRTEPYSPESRFVGGAVGYFSYDSVRYWEKLPETTIDDQGFPNVEVGIFDDGILFDHLNGCTLYHHRGEGRLSEIKRLLKEHCDFEPLSYTEPKTNVTKDYFEDTVLKAKEYIGAGDIFQVVLSKRHEFRIKGDLINFYKALREINPSPYMYFLKMGERSIVGSSPEMLVRVEANTVETFPIAGTRPLGSTPSETKSLTQDLLADPKERAEHVMLVDLARNDIGRVAKMGSVHVPEFMEVHYYSHVQHIVSRVVGELDRNQNCYDALRAVFPAGTVSGAPKVRAMEIIEELEKTRRGPYAGAVGYFSYNGNADFAITIRTLVSNRDRAFIQVGGGIVADSVPENEWFETEHKARALMRALEISGGK